MSIGSVITLGFGAPGSKALVVTLGFGQGAAVPVVVDTNFGGDDAPPIRRRKEFSRPEKEIIAEDIRKIYEQLPEQQQLEVKSDVVRFAEKLPPRKKPVPVSNIDFAALANNLAAVQAILDAYEQQTLYILAQEERDIEMLLMGI